jgi:hypothetical protein
MRTAFIFPFFMGSPPPGVEKNACLFFAAFGLLYPTIVLHPGTGNHSGKFIE